MNRFVPIAIAFVFVLYALIDVLLSRGSEVRTFPRWVWALVVVLLPVLGALGWFVLGRPRRATAGGAGGSGRGPAAPDDDPAFLRELEAKAWSEQMRKRREGGGPAASDGTGPAAAPGDRADDASTDGPAVDSGSPGPSD